MTTKARKMTPKDFVPHLTHVLADLSGGQPGVAVPMGDTFDPVCGRMGISVEEFGESEHGKSTRKTPWVHRQIGLAFRQMRDKGLGEYAKKGHWALTSAAFAGMDGASVPIAAKSQATDDVDDADEGGEVIMISSNNAQQEHPYSDDPYIRGLAIAQTKCLGAYSKRSDVCKGCPLRHDCIVAIGARKAEIAAELEAEEQAAKSAAENAAKKKAKQNASIDELMASIGDEKAAKKAAFGKNGKFKPSRDQNVAEAFAQRESFCVQCGEKVAEGAECSWVEGEGIFHNECIDLS
jgi:hypothetical protein